MLDGEEGRFGLSVQKMVEVIASGSTLLAKEKWSEGELRHFVGKATFGCCFRRPLFAILESVFEEINVRASQNDREVPRPGAWDEVAIRVLLTPLMYSYLKARIDPEVSVTDASPSGGGAATAVEFQSAPCTIDVAGPMAESLALKESFMVKGQEKEHLATLLRQATNRGSDVRSFLEVDGEMHEQPFFAMRWQWRTAMSYAWRQEAHFNELELLAVAVFLKRRARTRSKQHLRFFHVLDSMVSRGVLAKGRSSSRRLNSVARRCSAYMLAMDSYMFPLWTIIGWYLADKASRAHEA